MAKVNIFKTKWFVILVSVSLVALAVGLSVGLTASYWSDEGAGDTAVAPSGTTYNWKARLKRLKVKSLKMTNTLSISDHSIHQPMVLCVIVCHLMVR